jgi:uncharacterized damage-inducible protein DinB
MTDTMTDRFCRWFVYEKETNAKVLGSLATVPENRREEDPYREALELFGHMIAARSFWLYRFGIAPQPENLFPEETSIDDLAARAQTMYAAWDGYLATLTDSELSNCFEYQSTEGDKYRNKKEDILKQLSDHGRYHCGQIASRIKACGGTAATTDYVFFVRELVK